MLEQARLDTLVTLTCRVMSSRDVTSQVEYGLYLSQCLGLADENVNTEVGVALAYLIC